MKNLLRYACMPNGNSSFLIPHSSFKKVLLIDDDRIQLTLTAAMLRQSGIDSVTCLQLDELLDALRADTFDALFTDVQMPAIDGFDLLQLLRASNIPQARTIPIIAVTARSDMKREEFVAHGFAGCLHKPFTVRELLREMNVEEQEVPTEKHELPDEEPCATESSAGYNFSALTAFADDDPEAAKSIVESFVSETRLNAERLEKAMGAQDMPEIAAVSHKMIPVFTLIGASALVSLLKELEASRGVSFSTEIGLRVQTALSLIDEVLGSLQKF